MQDGHGHQAMEWTPGFRRIPESQTFETLSYNLRDMILPTYPAVDSGSSGEALRAFVDLVSRPTLQVEKERWRQDVHIRQLGEERECEFCCLACDREPDWAVEELKLKVGFDQPY